MSKKQERLRSELLSEDKITNLLGFLTEKNPGGWSIYRVKNPSAQIRILRHFGGFLSILDLLRVEQY